MSGNISAHFDEMLGITDHVGILHTLMPGAIFHCPFHFTQSLCNKLINLKEKKQPHQLAWVSEIF